jgi:hypothetical protein
MKYLSLLLLLAACSKEVSEPPVVSNKYFEIDEVVIAAEAISRNELLSPLFTSMQKQIVEKLPFDEPLRENGRQLDGMLRTMWLDAYMHNKKTYALENTRYRTFGSKTTPLVPQVCADFIVDTIDRAAGTWYADSLKHPKRIVGKFDFRKEVQLADLNPRNVDHLIKYFRTRPNDFEFVFDGDDGPVVGEIIVLKKWFKDKVQLGDLIIIKGRAPWDRGKSIHYHSFFVTKMNNDEILITGNANFPAEWSLEREVSRAPKRKVVSVIRFTNEFLRKL